MMTNFTTFKGAAKRIDDIDLPVLAYRIGVGEDELHAVIDTETSGSGFDSQKRPKMLFEPHVFYRNLTGAKRNAAVKAGLAYPKWGEKPYPKDSYPRLKKAMAIDETAALKSASWGMGQILGENAESIGYDSVQYMVMAFTEDEEYHLAAMVDFIKVNGLDNELRKLAALTRKTTAADCVPFVKVYNGPGYAKNRYHTKMAAAHNKWRAIKDTPFDPATDLLMTGMKKIEPRHALDRTAPAFLSRPTMRPNGDPLVYDIQQALKERGYRDVGDIDGLMGTKTRGMILAFQADNGIKPTGQPSASLLEAILATQMRPLPMERITATAKDLKAKGDNVTSGADLMKKFGGIVLGSGVLGGVMDGTASFDDLTTGLSNVRTLTEMLSNLGPWVIAAAVGGVAFYYGRKIVKEQVAAYREGRSL